jgi:hypothetical protein
MFTCQFPDGEMRLYHGVSRRRYEQMLMNCGWNRELSSNLSDFVSDETALYFTNDPAYALFWSTVKSCGFSRVDHRLDELQGIVIEVRMNTASWMGAVTVIPRRITDDFIAANWSYQSSAFPEVETTMILGGFHTGHLAQLKSEMPMPGAASEFVDVDNLLQIAFRGKTGEQWLRIQPFRVCFVSLFV